MKSKTPMCIIAMALFGVALPFVVVVIGES
jgi:hypothetical protein